MDFASPVVNVVLVMVRSSSIDVRLQGSVGTSMLDDLTMTSTTFTTGDAKSINQFQIY